jgi:hypothetical protein
VLAIAPELDFVPRLLAVIAAILSEAAFGLDHALTRGVRALGGFGHDHLLW